MSKRLLIVMDKDFRSADIWYDFKTKQVEVFNYEKEPLRRAIWKDNPDWNDFREFLEERSMTRTRVNLREILDALKLLEYDPWLYVQRTRGLVLRDSKWLRFGEEDNKECWATVSDVDYKVDWNYIDSLVDPEDNFSEYYAR